MLLTDEQYRALGYVGRTRETRRRVVAALARVDESLARSCARAADAGVPLRRIAAVAEVSHEHARRLAMRGRELLAADAERSAAATAAAAGRTQAPGARGRPTGKKRRKR